MIDAKAEVAMKSHRECDNAHSVTEMRHCIRLQRDDILSLREKLEISESAVIGLKRELVDCKEQLSNMCAKVKDMKAEVTEKRAILGRRRPTIY